ncbi:fimbria/pilus outer membrane usher protein [Erwinia sp. S59]|uniref:fimbria/pilus outer membrane usher protein n=1 Tax=Erwinia sp. S59 TaxID=2769340 RepID=UPI0019091285|nr:fimbria/pilus outer membrane usher protein [Erwinia sp. S59]MBK0089726.1 fimbrial biogenesis outer membrane usher protein [Erwinia sp. S59]
MTLLHPKPRLLALLASVTFVLQSEEVYAADYFDPAFLTLSGVDVQELDLSAFATSGKVPAGTYLVTVVVNQNEVGQFTIAFAADNSGNVVAQLTPDFLQQMGVNVQGLPAFRDWPADKPVTQLSNLIEHARVKFDFSALQLDLSIPQIAMQPSALSAIKPEKWDHGIPAIVMNYSLNGSRTLQEKRGSSSNLFGNLSGGANYGAWRVRSNLYWYRAQSQFGTGNSVTQQKFQFANTYLMRDVVAWKAEVMAGESSTASDVFNSVPFRGMKLNSQDEMLPYVMRGFAPVIEGIAQSNARVTVLQNNNIIYQTYVAPGPFRLEDLGQMGSGGDLIVNVTEADGRVHSQTIPVSTVPVMRRPGSLKYEVTAGRYDGGLTNGTLAARFVQATAIYGLPFNTTLYGGALLSRDYHSWVAGSGISLGAIGAISADITSSNAKVVGSNSTQNGQSYRLRYAKSLLSTGTAIDLAAYRYSTRRYYSFADYNNSGFRLNDDLAPWTRDRQRSSFQARLSQSLGAIGSAYLSTSRTDYWGRSQVINSLSSGFNGSYRGINYTLAYNIERTKGNGEWPEDRTLTFNTTVPFSLFSSRSAMSQTYASYQASHNNRGQVQQLAGFSGNALDSRLTYGVMQGWANEQQQRSHQSLSLAYAGSKGSLASGYSRSGGSQSMNLGGNGAFVLHPEGLTLSKMVGNSVAIISAPGSQGAKVGNGGSYIDSRGFAVVPYLTNYQLNNISLDPSTLPENVDLTDSSVAVYPTKGAVVRANFATKVGYQALLTLQRRDKSIPFGATASVIDVTDSEVNSGLVGDAGQLYMSGLPEQGRLLVKWGKRSEQQCQVKFNLKNISAPSANNPIRIVKAECE